MRAKHFRYTFPAIALMLVASLSPVLTNTASAWSAGQQPTMCSSPPSTLLATASEVLVNRPTDGFNPATDSWAIIGHKDSGGTLTYYRAMVGNGQWLTADDLGYGSYVAGTPSLKYWLGFRGSSHYVDLAPDGTKLVPSQVNPNIYSGSQLFILTGGSSDECLVSYKNVEKTTAFSTDFGSGAVTGEAADPEPETCDWYDLVCVAQMIWTAITDGFSNLMDWLANSITDIVGPIIEAIIPGTDNDSIFSDMFTNLKTGLDEKLGFLTYPFEWFGDFFTNVAEISWSGGAAPTCDGVTTTFAYCSLSVEVWQGQDIKIEFGAMERMFPQVWDIGIIFVRFAFFIAIIEMLRRAYFRTVKG